MKNLLPRNDRFVTVQSVRMLYVLYYGCMFCIMVVCFVLWLYVLYLVVLWLYVLYYGCMILYASVYT